MADPATFSPVFVALQEASLQLAPRRVEMLAGIYACLMLHPFLMLTFIPTKC